MTVINGITIEDHFGLVGMMVRRFGRSATAACSTEDLFSEGVTGLMAAAEKFDHERGLKFSTYAVWWIRHMLHRAIDNQSRTVRTPVHAIEARRKRGLGPPPRDLYLDDPIGSRGGSTWLDQTMYPEADDDEMPDVLAADRVRAQVAQLPERLAMIVRRRFGLGGAREGTLLEIGQDMGVSRERVRQLEAEALGMLRRQASA